MKVINKLSPNKINAHGKIYNVLYSSSRHESQRVSRLMGNASKVRAKKYIQSHTIDTPLNDGLKESRGMQPAYDGVAEVWFESEEDLMAAMSSPEFQEAAPSLMEDENKFIDHSKSTAFILNEIEL